MSDPASQFPASAPESRRETAASRARLRKSPGADDWRRSFLRMVSHELRTPLNSIIGFSEIIGGELYGPIGDVRYREHAKLIRASGMKLLKLVNQVLEIARLDAGAADLHLQPEPPAGALKAALRRLEDEADARRIAFRIEMAPATPLVVADARGLETILVNLLQNAIAFSPEGGTIDIDIRPVGSCVQFTIADAGEGVPEQDIPRLLLPFMQGENALTRRSEGAGLGLPIVNLLCSDMGGRLQLNSPPGSGLQAVVKLPAAPPNEPLAA